jgi:hypothetical protein
MWEECLTNSRHDSNELPNSMKDEEKSDFLRILPSQEWIENEWAFLIEEKQFFKYVYPVRC